MKSKISIINLFAFIIATQIVLSTELSVAQRSCVDLFKTLSARELSQSTYAVFNHLENTTLKLYETSGFKNDQEIIRAAESTVGPTGVLYRQALDILAHENLTVVTRLPVKIRSKIAKEGFLNAHQSGRSQGSVLGRDPIEASYTNLDDQQWKNLPDAVKPKYAAIYPKPESNLIAPESLNRYTGTDKYHFKLDRIRDRITVTPGDSLNRFKYWQGPGFQAVRPEFWDQAFIPWKHRFLLIPCLAAGLKQGRMGLPKIFPITKDLHPDEYGNQNEIVGEGDLSAYTMRWSPNMDYLEVQIWGQLTLDDVAVFEYGSSPPTGPLLRELQRRGIEIRDGRKTKPTDPAEKSE